MAALGSQSIASSYEQLLHVDADGGGNGTTHVSVKDGDNGTTFALTLATDAVMITSDNRLEFGDDGTYIHQSANGVLDLVSDSEIEINATTIDMNGAVDVSGATQLNSALTVGEDDTGYDVKFFGATATNGYMLWDESTDDLILGSSSKLGIGTATPEGDGMHVYLGDGGTSPSWEANRTGLIIESASEAHLALYGATVSSLKFSTSSKLSNGSIHYTHSNDAMAFGVAETERMRIDSSGNVGIAMTPGGSHKLDVTGSAGLSTGTAWTNTSDERIKTNVETIENGLDKINQLRPVSFNYSEDYLEQHPEINASKKYNSFIAQEYADVFPDAVSIGGDLERVTVEGVEAADGIEAVEEEKETLVEDMLQFTPHDLNMYLVAAVKELSAKVEALEG